MKIKFFIYIVLLGGFILLTFVDSVSATCSTPIRVSGANAAAITPGMNMLRSQISLGGGNNGTGGTFSTGYREVDWDIPGMSTSFPIARDYYNTVIPKGLILDGAFDVSHGYVSGNSAPLLFGDINASYSSEFQAFSSPRLFGIAGGTPEYPAFVEFSFFIPGTTTPATVNGFGVVFTDVDLFNNATITPFGTDGLPIITPSSVGPVVTTLAADEGLSFVGISCTERIARVRIKVGQKILAAGNTDDDGISLDMVAMDDFIFGEPRPICSNCYFKPADFKGDGTSDYTVFRNGAWWILNNPGFTLDIKFWGSQCDIPINGDFNGDHIADFAVFRRNEPPNPPGYSYWYVQFSGIAPPPPLRVQWGSPGDIPVTGDYNGDNITDMAVWRPGSQGVFYVLLSPTFSGPTYTVPWGTTISSFPTSPNYADFPFVAAADPCPPY